MKLEFENVDEFIKFITFIFPETKESEDIIRQQIKEMKNESTILDNAVKANEG